jgi:hypothetical protein
VLYREYDLGFRRGRDEESECLGCIQDCMRYGVVVDGLEGRARRGEENLQAVNLEIFSFSGLLKNAVCFSIVSSQLPDVVDYVKVSHTNSFSVSP